MADNPGALFVPFWGATTGNLPLPIIASNTAGLGGCFDTRKARFAGLFAPALMDSLYH